MQDSGYRQDDERDLNNSLLSQFYMVYGLGFSQSSARQYRKSSLSTGEGRTFFSKDLLKELKLSNFVN